MRLKWLVVVALICGIPAFAGPILLNNTGMDGGVAIAGGELDTNWILVGGDYSPRVTNGSPDTFPFPYWTVNDTVSQWISPQSSYTAGVTTDGQDQNWIFRTSFDLTGMVPSTAQINGFWLADNMGIDIQINGVTYSPQQQTPQDNFADWSAFSVTSGFVEGINTLAFVVHNEDTTNGGPAGLRVEFGESFADDVEAVPEPATFGLLGAGLLTLGLIHRRRQRG